MQTRPETPQSKHPQPHDQESKTAPKPFAKHVGDKQVVNGIGDTGDEEKERHTAEEKNRVSRTRE